MEFENNNAFTTSDGLNEQVKSLLVKLNKNNNSNLKEEDIFRVKKFTYSGVLATKYLTETYSYGMFGIMKISELLINNKFLLPMLKYLKELECDKVLIPSMRESYAEYYQNLADAKTIYMFSDKQGDFINFYIENKNLFSKLQGLTIDYPIKNLNVEELYTDEMIWKNRNLIAFNCRSAEGLIEKRFEDFPKD